MRFSEITGQKEIKEKLAQLVRQNRLGHALLFLGREGTGALQLAIALSQYLCCEKVNPARAKTSSLFGEDAVKTALPPADSCGQCPSCQKAQQLIHPDIHFSYPVVTKKSG